MKKIVIVFVLGTLLMAGCRNNEIHTPSQESIEKSDDFLMVKKTTNEKSPFQYVILETLNSEYQPIMLGNAVGIHHEYSKTDINKGILEFENLISSLDIEDKNELGVQERADLQLITYLNLEHFIFNVVKPNSLFVADNLRRLFKYTEPLESRILSKALILAKPSLTESEYNDMLNYIMNLNKGGFEHLTMLMDSDISRLKSESIEAIELINQSNLD